jgi:signal peptidase II
VRAGYCSRVTIGLLALVVVPAIDQVIKAIARRALGGRTIRWRMLGELRLVESPMWMQRAVRPTQTVVWVVWSAAALFLVLSGCFASSFDWAAGLLLGGALSHAIETTVRGTVSDYVCLRFWPAFNLADVALTVGTVGLVVNAWYLLHAATR